MSGIAMTGYRHPTIIGTLTRGEHISWKAAIPLERFLHNPTNAIFASAGQGTAVLRTAPSSCKKGNIDREKQITAPISQIVTRITPGDTAISPNTSGVIRKSCNAGRPHPR